ncbi:glycosyltransferase [Thermoanaerobacterium thermosaccharolyticum]|uniref:glycosyltransferase n=1 Tax=Thermoanaerobacterium thermosaccharolyticum TaxID=1517 RepID=UPI002FDA0718
MNFVTLFPETENVHLVKDVGMIPFILHKKYGYDSKIVCYNNGDYPYLNNEVKGLKIEFIENTGDVSYDGYQYLVKNANNIDVLNVYHLINRTIMWITIYKYLNPYGKIFLKLDANENIKNVKLNNKLIDILNECNIVSVETKSLYEYIKNNWPIKIQYLPNGFYDYDIIKEIDYDDKKNIILTVGRLGTYQKATEILLQAYKLAFPYISNWKLKLVGTIEDNFRGYLKEYFSQNQSLVDNVIFTGEITDRKLLEELYMEAKIFCLPSRVEGFPLVFTEAAKNGCYIISTNIPPAYDITDNGKYGSLFNIDDVKTLASILIKNCSDDTIFKNNYKNIQNYAYNNFNWVNICGQINKFLMSEYQNIEIKQGLNINGLSSIIILTYNQIDYTKMCIESIRKYTKTPYEIIVVDNGSSDGTIEYLESQNDIKLIKNRENRGFAAGCNQGISIAEGEYIILLNNDTIVTENWLSNLLYCLNNANNAGIVGPVTNNISGDQKIITYYKNINDMHEFAGKFNVQNQKWRKSLRLVGYCMVMRKELFREIGLLDENYGIGNFEDDDLCLRALLKGYNLYINDTTFIHHFGSVTFKNMDINYAELMKKNEIYFKQKWGYSHSYYFFKRPEILNKIPLKARNILDVGCGAGALGLELKNRKDVNVVGIELNSDIAAIAKNVLDDVIVGDIESLAFDYPEKYFDTIILADVLEHLRDPWSTLTKMKRYLKDDGIFIVSIPNINHISIILKLLGGNFEYEDAGLLDKTHLRFFTKNTILQTFRECNLEILNIESVVLNNDYFNNIARIFSDIAKQMNISTNYEEEGITYQYIITARKYNNLYDNETISLCLITKDEEKNIARCINSVKDIVDEIVVVDTGSKDKTVEIAKSFGEKVKVINAKWEDDFSKARNIAIENATSDWILFLDADEEIKKEDVGKIRPLLSDDTVEAYILKFVNYAGTNSSNGLTEIHYNLRLFRNNGKLKYIYPVHENLRNIEENRVPVFKNADVTILHYGYLSETRIEKNKTERYIKLISRYLEEHPDDKFQHGNLAVEYFNAGNYNKALKHLLIATKGMDVNSYAATRLLRYLISTYSALKDYDTALRIINDAKAYYVDVPDFKFLEGMIYIDQKRYKKAIETFKECLSMGEYNGIFITMGGTGSYRAKFMIALCYEKLNKLNDAVKEYMEILKEHPKYQEVFIRVFDMFVRNEKPEDVYEFFNRHVDTKSPVNFAIMARLYINIGRFDIAKQYIDSIDIDLEGLNNLRGIIYMGLKDYENAIKHFEMEYGKAKEEANYREALCYIILKDIDKAKDLLWKITDSSDKKLYMTIVGEMKVKFDEVKDSFFNLLDLLMKLKEFDLYNEVLNLYVGLFTREEYERYGQMMINNGLDDLAVEAYIKAADLNSQNTEVYKYLAQKAYDQNMFNEALSIISNAYNIDKTDVDIYRLIYKIYKALGQDENADEVNEMVKSMYPEVDLSESYAAV